MFIFKDINPAQVIDNWFRWSKIQTTLEILETGNVLQIRIQEKYKPKYRDFLTYIAHVEFIETEGT